MGPREERRAALIAKFVDLGGERLANITALWLGLERAPGDEEASAELLRELHTLKGEAKTVGYPQLSELAHRLETVVIDARDRGYRVPPATSDAVLGTIDVLGALLRANPGEAPIEVAGVIARLDGLTTLDPQEQVPLPAPSAEAPAPAKEPGQFGRELSVRVLASRISRISDVAGELLVEQGRIALGVRRALADLDQVAEGLGAGAAGLSGVRAVLAGLDETTYQLGLNVNELEQTVRELRLVPVSTLLMPYSRMVRDLSRDQGKDAVLEVIGGEVEADKRVLEVLDEPLLHLLRNSIDHGLELPELRIASGKPAQGKLRVEVRYVGGALGMSVSDDGAGLDPVQLRARAVQRGFLTEAVASQLTDPQALDLIFLAGFSTRDQASALSGRGVGMDVVRRRVEQLGGRVRIESEKGVGLKIDIVAPISVSLTRALLLEVDGFKVALPSASIESIRTVAELRTTSSHEGSVLWVEDEPLSVASLDSLLLGRTRGAKPLAMVVRNGARRFAVLIDKLGREANLLVRPLGPPLTGHRLVTGAAVLDSGEIALALDVSELLLRHQGVASSAGRRPRARAAKVLVVDDSFIFLSTITDMVKALGHEVAVARNGAEALTVLADYPAALVVTDLQMPKLDGFGLIAALRKDARWASVPIVVMSTLGAAQDKQRAAEAGADAYIVKSDLSLAQVEEALGRFLHE